MLPGMEMLACPNLAVSPEVMQHIVRVESSANPYAIGVVRGQLERQPKNLPEALATVKMLDAKGYNFSVGLAQVNRANLGRYGLDSYRQAFNGCANLSAGAKILADCYKSAHSDWGKAFSCYYSGNFTNGFRDGYVQKVYASINQKVNESKKAPPVAEPIALRSEPTTRAANPTPTPPTNLKPVTVYASSDPNYRVALRSMAIDEAAAVTVSAIAGTIDHKSSPALDSSSGQAAVNATEVGGDQNSPMPSGTAKTMRGQTTAAADPTPVESGAHSLANEVFVPAVRGPNDAPGTATSAGLPPAFAQTSSSNSGSDSADLRQEQRDAAFVF